MEILFLSYMRFMTIAFNRYFFDDLFFVVSAGCSILGVSNDCGFRWEKS